MQWQCWEENEFNKALSAFRLVATRIFVDPTSLANTVRRSRFLNLFTTFISYFAARALDRLGLITSDDTYSHAQKKARLQEAGYKLRK
jgi:hypothetical protein